MKTHRKALLAFLTVTLMALATGCTSKTSKDTSIPWSRPASWEGQIPGMGEMSGNTSGTR